MLYLPALFEDAWRNEVLAYAFDKRRHPNWNFYADEKRKLTVTQFTELYYSRWSLPEDDWYPPPATPPRGRGVANARPTGKRSPC